MWEALIGFFFVFVPYAIPRTSATVSINSFSTSFPDLPAKSAVAVNRSGTCGALYVADPLDACSSLQNEGTEQTRLVLIIRGGCSFEDKIRNAQNAGFSAAIVYNDQNDGSLVYMMIHPKNITVHASFVTQFAGEILKRYAEEAIVRCCLYPNHYESSWTVLTISFISFVVICAIAVFVYFAPRHWSSSQGTLYRSQRVDVEMVEALPRFTFSSAHPRDCHTEDTCAICLEDYKDGEILTVLPCRHGFHSICMDSWLNKSGTFCPVCKHDLATKIACSDVKKGIRV